MKNHFVFAYAGNKRSEVETIYNNIIIPDTCTTIVEPFCGTSAMSYYISTQHPQRFKYVLNDMNPYIKQLYEILQSEERTEELIQELKTTYHTHDKALYLSIIQRGHNSRTGMTFIGWFLSHVSHSIVVGLFDIRGTTETVHKKFDKIRNTPIIQFLRNEQVEITCVDGMDVYIPYSKRECLLFLDPPYLISDNTQYDCNNQLVYEYLFTNKIEHEPAYIVLCLEWSWIVKLLFPTPVHTYKKQYQANKKNTMHAIITNRK